MKRCPRVLIVIGSSSDADMVSDALATLKSFGVPYKLVVSSAHRTPQRTAALARNARDQGIRVIIAGAGWSAGLPGALAAETTLPVIGIPIPSSVLLGMDAMLSMVQMPPGVPVATMAVGKGGARNAALFAVQILAMEFPELVTALQEYKNQLSEKVIKTAEAHEEIWEG